MQLEHYNLEILNIENRATAKVGHNHIIQEKNPRQLVNKYYLTCKKIHHGAND